MPDKTYAREGSIGASSSKNHRLRCARQHRFWSQALAAEKAEVSERTYMRWELGTQTPRAYNLALLCSAFALTPAELGFEHLVPPPEQVCPSEPERLEDTPAPLISLTAWRKAHAG